MTSDPQVLTVRLPADLYHKLRRAAFDLQTSMNALVVEAVQAKLSSGAAGHAESRPAEIGLARTSLAQSSLAWPSHAQSSRDPDMP